MALFENIKIVLVEPSHPGNIGGAARAMKNMGLSQLVVVNPKRYPDPQADWRAAGALDILDGTTVVDTVETAIADCHWVVGTSTRLRKIPWPVTDAKGIAKQVVEQANEAQIAILFGREDSGLTNEELRRCHYHLQIPAAPEYSSLNLAMAVQVVCYELFQASQSEPVVTAWDRRMATSAELDAMLVHLEETLLDGGFLLAENPGQTMTRVRRMFSRMQLDETEVQIMRGIIKHFSRVDSSSSEPPQQ